MMQIGKNGVITESSFSEYHMNCKYDSQIYVEPDGSQWLRIFHHNNPASYLFSSSNDFVNGCYVDVNRWFNINLCNFLNKWEFIIKQKATSSASETKFRWVQTVNPMTATYAQVSSSNITKNTSSGYSSWSHGGLYHMGGNTYLGTNNGNEGNWWGAVGSWTAYNGGIPGWNSVCPTTGYVDLYVRVENASLNTPATLVQDGKVQLECGEIKEV